MHQTLWQKFHQPAGNGSLANTINPASLIDKIIVVPDMRIKEHRTAQSSGTKYGKNHRPKWCRFKLAAYFRGNNKEAHSPYGSLDTFKRYENKIAYPVRNEEKGYIAVMKLASKLAINNRVGYKNFEVYANLTDNIDIDSDNYNYFINEFKDGKWQYPFKILEWTSRANSKHSGMPHRVLDCARVFQLNPQFDNAGRPKGTIYNQTTLL